MFRFNNDYNRGAHPEILKALAQNNEESYPGYGADRWCERAQAEILKHLGGVKAQVHFIVGGTPTNATLIAAALRPWQSVISVDTGHINAHEAGSIELTGHKVLAVPAENGKLTARAVEEECRRYLDGGAPEYLTQPKLAYISSPSEFGTVYSKAELEELSAVCKKYGLYLFLDGARLGYWLASEGCDVTLADLARLTDAFYIGGTKCGALFGEALVLGNPALQDHFRTCMKQRGDVLAKGWLMGLQFYTLFQNGLYFDLARRADRQAMEIKAAFQKAGIPLWVDSPTNQQFAVVSREQEAALAQNFIFELNHAVDAQHNCIRFCTSWSTRDEEVAALIAAIESLPGCEEAK